MSSFDLVRIRSFISTQEQSDLYQLALSYRDEGVLEANTRGPGRFRAKIWGTPYCTPLIHEVGKRIVAGFHLAQCPVDPQLGWIISLLEPGAQIHPHIDKYPYHEQHNTKHLRCNIMISSDNASGNPVIAGNSVDVPERALWGFFPSEVGHSTKIIQTTSPRVVYQFGFVVPGDYRFPQQD